MGHHPTGRQNKRTSERRGEQQTASQRPSTLTVVQEPGGWSWSIEMAGQTYKSGTPPASGPAAFNDRAQALSAVEANFISLQTMAYHERRARRAERSATNLQPPVPQ